MSIPLLASLNALKAHQPILRTLPIEAIRGGLIEVTIPVEQQALSSATAKRSKGSTTTTNNLSVTHAIRELKIGSICRLAVPESTPIRAEVVAASQRGLQLMPIDPAWDIPLQARLIIPDPLKDDTSLLPTEPIGVGPDLLGRVVDSLGEPLDAHGPIPIVTRKSFFREPPHVLKRKPINQIFLTGVRSIDSLLTVGEGQRMGIFSGAGVGKSTLLSMIARHSVSDVAVVALIGERGREVQEFIRENLGEAGMRKTVVIVSSPNDPPLRRVRAAYTATVIAEYFRDEGKSVVLMLDSLTRLAYAQREIALLRGEPPASRGYPPSVLTMLGELLERAGTSDRGSITAFYNVLVDGDDLDDPISDSVRGILDGHIVLSRKLAEEGHFPAISIPQSLSRLMRNLTSPEHQQAAARLRTWIARVAENEALISIGAYAQGSDPILDQALKQRATWTKFLRQSEKSEHVDDFPTILNALTALAPPTERPAP